MELSQPMTFTVPKKDMRRNNNSSNNNNNRPFKKRHPQHHHHSARQPQEPYQEPDLSALMEKTLKDLMDIAKEASIPNPSKLRKQDLALKIFQTEEAKANTRKGILEIMPEGYGFLRVNGYFPSSDDVYISQAQIKRFRLQTGHTLVGQIRPAKEGEKYASMIKVDSANGLEPEKIQHLRPFDSLVPVYPEGHLNLETPRHDISTRLMDIFAPIGKGQRGLIVSPPKAGKTTLLKSIAHSIAANHPDVVLIALLIDERPEEVTDFERSVKGEVVASTFDRPPEHHTRITELVLEKAKRLVEAGRDVVILVDSITRMSRAYNLIIPPSGRTLSGGLDPNAMHSPKRFFGAARNMEHGGSLTILATALVDTGSRMDEVIFEEFKGTGNMELRLDRKLAERRMFPAIDIKLSGTRKEELLLTNDVLRKEHLLRRMLSNADTVEATEFILERFKKSKTNSEFLQTIVDDNEPQN
jgi:transcription termination factor Rho